MRLTLPEVDDSAAPDSLGLAALPEHPLQPLPDGVVRQHACVARRGDARAVVGSGRVVLDLGAQLGDRAVGLELFAYAEQRG